VEKFLIEIQSKELYKSLMYYAKRLCNHNVEECEDLVQETYLKAIDKKDSFQFDKADMKYWLLSIMHNIFIDKKRRNKIENKMYPVSLFKEGGNNDEYRETVEEREELGIFDENLNPLEILEHREYKAKVKYLKKNLKKYIKNEKMYTVVMARLLGVKYIEISELFDINIESCKAMYFRFKETHVEKLKNEMKTYI
jgi:RNA polymerase sigma factor (sigma-70 family)